MEDAQMVVLVQNSNDPCAMKHVLQSQQVSAPAFHQEGLGPRPTSAAAHLKPLQQSDRAATSEPSHSARASLDTSQHQMATMAPHRSSFESSSLLHGSQDRRDNATTTATTTTAAGATKGVSSLSTSSASSSCSDISPFLTQTLVADDATHDLTREDYYRTEHHQAPCAVSSAQRLQHGNVIDMKRLPSRLRSSPATFQLPVDRRRSGSGAQPQLQQQQQQQQQQQLRRTNVPPSFPRPGGPYNTNNDTSNSHTNDDDGRFDHLPSADLAAMLFEAFGPAEAAPQTPTSSAKPTNATASPMDSARRQQQQRSSIDILLNSGTTTNTHSTDSLQELLVTSAFGPSGRCSLDAFSRHSSKFGGGGFDAGVAIGQRSAAVGIGQNGAPASRDASSMSSARALADKLGSLGVGVTVFAKPKPRTTAAAGPSAGARASTMVDQSPPSSLNSRALLSGTVNSTTSGTGAGGGGAGPMSFEDAIKQQPWLTTRTPLDADLHDTFGAHAWVRDQTAPLPCVSTAHRVSGGGGGGFGAYDSKFSGYASSNSSSRPSREHEQRQQQQRRASDERAPYNDGAARREQFGSHSLEKTSSSGLERGDATRPQSSGARFVTFSQDGPSNSPSPPPPSSTGVIEGGDDGACTTQQQQQQQRDQVTDGGTSSQDEAAGFASSLDEQIPRPTPTRSRSLHVQGGAAAGNTGMLAGVAGHPSSLASALAPQGSSMPSSAEPVNVKVGRARLLEPTTVHGQHSVTLNDAQCTVPTYDFLRQRRQLAKQQLQFNDSGREGSGYIAEAKRVLNEAMSKTSKAEAETCQSSYSGAIGPLLRHVRESAGDDALARAALRTLGLLAFNLPNRGIALELQGRTALMEVLRRAKALDVRETAVRVLWDLDPNCDAEHAAATLKFDDVTALLGLLEDTSDAVVASHALHLVHAAMEVACEGAVRASASASQLAEVAGRVVKEATRHKHHLQDAAVYTLGELLASLLSDEAMDDGPVAAAIAALLDDLHKCKSAEQCQVLLTVLSCLAGRQRLRHVLGSTPEARATLLSLARRAVDTRLQARAMSLAKVVGAMGGCSPADVAGTSPPPAAAHAVERSWYFGA